MSDTKPELTDKEIRNAATLLKFVWGVLVTLFAVFVGTPLILNMIEYGASWANLPWIILIVALLLKR